MVTFTSQIPIILLLLLCATIFQRGMCSTKTLLRCNENDKSALLNFKHGVIDPSNKLFSWSNEEDCCAWKGVHCDNITSRVTRLDLKQQYLEGEINLSLLEIQFLNYLDLSLNGFTTLSLPSIFNQSLVTPNTHANFSNLQYLDLSFNEDLHIDNLHWLSQLSSLKSLNLSEINLANETNWLQSMSMHPSLLELSVASCHLSNINPFVKFVNFTSLVTLDLSGNSFDSELPHWLFNLSSDISHIDLSFNFLQGEIPKSLLSLRNLKSLRLNNNELNGSIPNWLGQHEHLQYLGLSENLFQGFIPSSLGNLSSLVDLSISSNSLNGSLPTSLGQLFNLRSLSIGGNSMSGVLSEKHFSNLSNLETLVLSSPFAFDLDSDWIPPFQLHGISLSNTILGPNFPAWIYTQRLLVYLEVPSSRISSINGDKFWKFVANITQLNLSNNNISADLSNVTLNSDFIFMSNNNFTGGLPSISTNVFLLDVSLNSFSGSISHFLCHKLGRQNMLNYLDISSNLLTGSIPDCWENWNGLYFLFMAGNRLTGEIPPSMSSLYELIEMDLHKNFLCGNFSLDLSNLKTLVFINLGENNFSGAIPVKMPQSVEVMILRSNQFSGNIPPQLCNLSSLIQFDLSQNKLSGPIPRCIYNITPMDGVRRITHFRFSVNLFWKGQELDFEDTGLLRDLDLSTNNFSGEIPPELFGLTQLIFLNLSRNHFVGKIPRRIGDMKNLESLDLSKNHLSGEIPTSITNLSFLSYLNLSYNDFSGQIPLGTQLQSFDAWSYVGNPKLCGVPLTEDCTKEENLDKAKQGGDSDPFKDSLYLGMGVGFAVGFWGICGFLFLNRALRHTCFRFFDHIADQIYVFVAVMFNKFGSR